MSNQYFKFKKFTINQHNTAMKVGVDAVLLGSWVDPGKSARILDIGTGTGLLSLMLAQKSDAQIVAIEIEEGAYIQAIENIKASKWADRINVQKISLQEFVLNNACKKTLCWIRKRQVQGLRRQKKRSLLFVNEHFSDKRNEEIGVFLPTLNNSKTFDFIICNPPFFNSTLVSPDNQRTIARHDLNLDLKKLFSCVAQLLDINGRFLMIYQYNRKEEVISEASLNNLYPYKILEIKGNERKSPNRIIFEFGRESGICIESEMVIRNSTTNEYTDEYKELTKDYYLSF